MIGKKQLKLSLFTEGRIECVENLKEYTTELHVTLIKVTGYWVNTQKLIAFMYTTKTIEKLNYKTQAFKIGSKWFNQYIGTNKNKVCKNIL